MHRDKIFIAGGQPTVTYVDRKDQDVERMLARAIALPNQIVSLAGPTKTGKTVLCRKVLSKREYVWVDGGKISSTQVFWGIITAELNIPYEKSTENGSETGIEFEGSIPLISTASGSRLKTYNSASSVKVDSVGQALDYMTKKNIILVIDDFHYLAPEHRIEIMRNIKGAVFNGLKVLLLSVTHRVFDAIIAEKELTGRFTAVNLPAWNREELEQIPAKGFEQLHITCPADIVDKLCLEAQENPFLIQRFCWEVCFDLGIENPTFLTSQSIPMDYNVNEMFERLAKDAGLPIYKQLAAGPQSRKTRADRPLKDGGSVDIYEATLRALAETGPKSTVKYDEIRTNMNSLLSDMVPPKHEITAALKQLAKISNTIGAESAIDWNEETREVTIADPYLRFYLRWQVRQNRTV